MNPISSSAQSTLFQKTSDLNLAAHIMGDHQLSSKIGRTAILQEIHSGRWAEACAQTHGTLDQNLLLLWLGSAQSIFYTNSGYNLYGRLTYLSFDDVTEIATDLVAVGIDPWQQDKEGRDALDQAFALGQVDLIKAWLPLAPPHAKKLADRNYKSLPWVQACVCLPPEIPLNVLNTMITTMWDLGLSPNQLDEQGNNALFWVNKPESIEHLLKAGIDPHHRNHQDDTAPGFWLKDRHLTQTAVQAWTRLLPKLKKNTLSRENQVQDFYAAQEEGGKSLLAPLWGKLTLQKGEVNKDGLSSLGVLGKRLLSNSNKYQSGTEKNKASTWAYWLLEQESAWDMASDKDIEIMVAGAVLFGLDMKKFLPSNQVSRVDALIDGTYTHLNDAVSLCVGNGENAYSKMSAIHGYLGLFLLRDNSLPASLKMPPEKLQYWKTEYLEKTVGLVKSGFDKYSYHGDVKTASDLLGAKPDVFNALNLWNEPTMWKVVLCIKDNLGADVLGINMEWLKKLKNQGTLFPDGMDEYVNEQMGQGNDKTRDILSLIRREALAEQTSPLAISTPHSRPRL